jgi:ribosomal protein L40E
MEKIIRERKIFIIGYILTVLGALGGSYYFLSTAVYLDVPEFYNGLVFMLESVTLIAHSIVFFLVVRFSRILQQRWWVTAIFGILVFGLSMIVFIGLLVAANDKINNLKQKNLEYIADGELKKCPYCAELIKAEATVCKHCGRDLADNTKLSALYRTPVKQQESQILWHKICPNCNTPNPQNAFYCQSCNESLKGIETKRANIDTTGTGSLSFRTCLKCHHSNPKNALTCEECGTKF